MNYPLAIWLHGPGNAEAKLMRAVQQNLIGSNLNNSIQPAAISFPESTYRGLMGSFRKGESSFDSKSDFSCLQSSDSRIVDDAIRSFPVPDYYL
jgi:hypothetical protein